MLFDWILTHGEILKIVYAMIICFICATIVLKTNRLFKLSDYQGLRYFRNSFFFYGLAFFIRFILGGISDLSGNFLNTSYLLVFFEFFIITAGFFLLYSFTWKYAEYKGNYYSLFNPKAGIFYILAFLIAGLDYMFSTGFFMYASQIILFIVMGFISYSKLVSEKKKHKSMKYYFIVILLGLFAWILNMLLEYSPNLNKVIPAAVYSINILFFAFFFYVITKITRNKNG
jgi:hypothetical protein